MEINIKALIYGILAGVGILAFYISVLTIFQSYGFALSEFNRLWFWLVPLAVGFGTQIGLYASIRHDATVNRGMAASGTVSGGSMIACCSHYFLSILPFIGIAGLSPFTSFLMTYQKAFFSIGIASSIIGVTLMLNHKRKMKAHEDAKPSNYKISNEMKGGLRLMATEKKSDTFHISGKAIAVIGILLLLLVGTFGMFLLKSSPNNTGSVSAQTDSVSGDIPEKCRLPAGQDVTSWKEHLGHHEDTKECLKYFN